MSFEQYVAKVKKLVNNCDIENAEAKEAMIQNFIVTGANSQTAYRQCVEAGPGAKLDRILDIYRTKQQYKLILALYITANHQYTK